MDIELAPDSLVLLVGASGSGKSTWARRRFAETQVVSSDRCRALVVDDEADQTVNREAFAVFYTILRQRLSLGRLSVADSTALQEHSRRRLRELAAAYGRPVHAVLFLAPAEVLARHNQRRERRVAPEVLLRHAELTRSLVEDRVLEAEGYAGVHYLRHPGAAQAWPRVLPPLPADPAETASPT